MRFLSLFLLLLTPSFVLAEGVKTSKKDSFYSLGVGTFVRGKWNRPPIVHSCVVWTGCYNYLEGINLSGNYIKELYKKGVWSLDIDLTSMIGYQSAKENYLYDEIETDSSIYAILGLIPTLRVKTLGNSFPPIGFGVGMGPSYTIGNRVVDKPYNFPKVLSQVNAEITYALGNKKDSSIVLGLSHICSFFGLLKSDEGTNLGHHWYSVSYRKKI